MPSWFVVRILYREIATANRSFVCLSVNQDSYPSHQDWWPLQSTFHVRSLSSTSPCQLGGTP